MNSGAAPAASASISICHSAFATPALAFDTPGLGFATPGSTRSRTNAYQPHTQHHSAQHLATPACHPGECRLRRWI
jgi:hypothetical protein